MTRFLLTIEELLTGSRLLGYPRSFSSDNFMEKSSKRRMSRWMLSSTIAFLNTIYNNYCFTSSNDESSDGAFGQLGHPQTELSWPLLCFIFAVVLAEGSGSSEVIYSRLVQSAFVACCCSVLSGFTSFRLPLANSTQPALVFMRLIVCYFLKLFIMGSTAMLYQAFSVSSQL